jgi:hypothetical protein
VNPKRAFIVLVLPAVLLGVAAYAYQVHQASAAIEGFLRVVSGNGRTDQDNLASSVVLAGNDTVADITRVERLTIKASKLRAPAVYDAYWRPLALEEGLDTIRFRARIREHLPAGGVVIELLPLGLDSAGPSAIGLRMHPSLRIIPVECAEHQDESCEGGNEHST